MVALFPPASPWWQRTCRDMLTLRWTLRAKRACVWLRTPSLTGSLLSPASADGPPRGLSGGGAVAPTRLRGVSVCPSASVRELARRGLPPKSGRRPQPDRLPTIIKRERMRNRREYLHCCAGRAAPASPVSCAAPAGSRILCAASWLLWCARSLGSGLSRRRQTASACIGSLAEVLPTARVSRVRNHAAARDRPGRNRGRDRSSALACA